MNKILKLGVMVVSLFWGVGFIKAEVTEEDFDKLYNEIVKDGVIYLDTVVPNNFDEAEGLLNFAVRKYETKDLGLSVGSDVNNLETYHLTIYSNEDSRVSKTYNVKVSFNPSNKNIQKKVSEYVSKFPKEGTIEDKLLRMDDLDIINYYYNIHSLDISNNIGTVNQIINYSSDLKQILSNSNIKATLDTRAGWNDDFSNGGFGFLVLSYNGFAYGVVLEGGAKSNNVIYIPNNTENTREAFIDAAKKRIDAYLKVDSIKISYGGQISDINTDDWILPLEEIVNVDNTIGEYYIFNINGKEYKFFIEKNSDKMRNGEFSTVDINSNAIINSNSPVVPLDSMINFETFSKNSDEYKQILKTLGLDDALVANINLYSSSKKEYVTKLENGKFKVYVPITKDMENRDLKAYYITDDNKIEEYAVNIIDGYAVFETNHFSTYTIGGKINSSNIENPNTYDGILKSILLGGISVLCLVFIGFNIKKRIKSN